MLGNVPSSRRGLSLAKVRSAYRRKGWALANVDHIQQCAHDLYTESIKEQTGEGCHMWGMMEVRIQHVRLIVHACPPICDDERPLLRHAVPHGACNPPFPSHLLMRKD